MLSYFFVIVKQNYLASSAASPQTDTSAFCTMTILWGMIPLPSPKRLPPTRSPRFGGHRVVAQAGDHAINGAFGERTLQII
jgi:hypothetical protein